MRSRGVIVVDWSLVSLAKHSIVRTEIGLTGAGGLAGGGGCCLCASLSSTSATLFRGP